MSIYDILTTGAYLLLALLATELLAKKHLKKVFMLRWYNSLLSMLLFVDLALFFTALSGRFLASLQVVTLASVALGLAGRIKIDYRQTGFTPIDLLILKEAGSMAGALNPREVRKLAVSALLSGGFLLAFSLILPVPVLAPALRIGIVAGNLLLLAAVWLAAPYVNNRLSVYRIGVLPYFFAYLRDPVRLERRPGAASSSSSSSNPGHAGGSELPDILVIQSESFADPFVLGPERFNADPLPFYHRLREESIRFDMATRAFGGGTVHTEYEILTGLSSVFFPRDTTVFSRYLKTPTVSLGSIASLQGYRTKMIHPYLDWYYNRSQVYRNLGFDEFQTLRSFPDPEGRYMPDRVVGERILGELRDSQPSFLFAVTMQNHTPYKEERYPHGLRFLGDLPGRETKAHFDHYLNGLRETDLALEELIGELRKRDRETLVLFYGDHLPVINQDAGFYEEIRWSRHPFGTREYAYELSLSPGLIWSSKRNLDRDAGVLDCTRILPLLLSQTRLPAPSYLKELGAYGERNGINGLFRDFLVREGRFFGPDDPVFREAYQAYRALNSRVFYGTDDASWRHVSPDYTIR